MKTLKEAATIIAGLTEQIVVLEERLTKLESSSPKRDRGPASTRDMTEDDARRIMYGDMEKVSHADAAKELGLSYGQVYSARGGYTFKKIFNERFEKK